MGWDSSAAAEPASPLGSGVAWLGWNGYPEPAIEPNTTGFANHHLGNQSENLDASHTATFFNPQGYGRIVRRIVGMATKGLESGIVTQYGGDFQKRQGYNIIFFGCKHPFFEDGTTSKD
ncbi:hypothetical protein AB5N19_12475 [Seiridium cardinale]